MYTLYNTSLLQLGFGHSTNAICSKIGVSRLYTPKAAQIFITGFLPFCNQISIGNFFFQTIIVQLTADGFSAIEQIIDVTGLLVVDLKDGPQGFIDAFAFVRFSFG
jgi:hypothetical protein